MLQNLSNKILVATPLRLAKGIFYESVIYVLNHSPNGSIGLIINSKSDEAYLSDILTNLEIKFDYKKEKTSKIQTYIGGPVSPSKGFVIHSTEYDNADVLCKLPCGLSISSNNQILKDIYYGKGPKESMLILGHTIWREGEMEDEIKEDLWLVLEPTKELIFDDKGKDLWHDALKHLGLDHASFASKTASG